MLLALAAALPAFARPDAGEPVDFQREIRPILADRCYACHGPDAAAREAGLRLDMAAGATAVGRDGSAAIVPGAPDRSLLLQRVTASDDRDRMPPAEAGDPLTPAQVDALRRWIAQGAVYETHWSFRPVAAPALPTVIDGSWPRNGIDRFVLARLEREGLAPAPEADRATLIRRVALDLTGLPPAPDEVEIFLSDDRAGAYERMVDRLLGSPHYGERWAAAWLDLARYADTKGYEADRQRTIWPYRDWVVRALNDDMPFDRFTIEQLAGDLLPDAGIEQRVATAFHRNTMTNDEGGTDDEEFRVAAVVDRVNTTMQVWMGMTMACAQCHDHKFDPISMQEYYRFFAYFNGTEDSDRVDEAPRMSVPSPEQRVHLQTLEDAIAALEASEAGLIERARAGYDAWEATRAALPVAAVTGGLVARYELDDGLDSAAGPAGAGTAAGGEPVFAPGVTGRALALGDGRHVVLGDVGDFDRDAAFSYGGWILPESGATMVPFARMDPSDDYRGYDVFLHERRAYVHIIHRWPDDLIRVNTRAALPVGEWTHFMVTYDGSGRAAGVAIHVDGRPAALEVTHDSLTGTIRTAAPMYLGRRHGERHFDGRLDDVRLYDRALDAGEVAAVADRGLRAMAALPRDERDEAVRTTLERVHLARLDGPLPEIREELAARRAQRDAVLAGVPSIPVMRELPPEQDRATHLLRGGSFLSPGETVAPGVPAVFHDGPAGPDADRLDLARWIVDPANPLTARVTVNRYWDRFFGAGLVETTEDFGTQGALPTHPELLDWLSERFVAGGWSLKSLCRLIVTSATYRQSSRAAPELRERDPDNRLLARGPRHRLPAETIRDQALAVSGLLNRELYGPPVFPPQPDGVWQIVYSNEQWTTAEGDDRYRRALYTFWRRTSPYPSMATFDAPSREFCVSRRIRTNTPLQALVTLNDPVFVEAAQGLARRVLREAGSDPADRAARALRLALAREPRRAEVAELAGLAEVLRGHYAADADAAETMATDPLGPLPDGLEPAEAAAWTVVANVVMNLDEFLMKH
jgi:mono/diheme cytochrome c family protein